MQENRDKKLNELKSKGEDKNYKIALMKAANPDFNPETETVPDLLASEILDKDLPKIRYKDIENLREEEFKDEDSTEYRLHSIQLHAKEVFAN